MAVLPLIARALDLYSLIVLVTVLLSWIRLSPDNPLVKFTKAVTEPVLGPIRRIVPSIGGLDISPMVLLVLLHLIRRALLSF